VLRRIAAMFQSDMDLSDDDLERFAAADRREMDPAIQVEVATWSAVRVWCISPLVTDKLADT
jgi:hypothetical protein